VFKISNETRAAVKPTLWGIALGALLLAVGGSYWPGYSIESRIVQRVAKHETVALVRVLAPICAEKFRTGADLTARTAELKGVDSWLRDQFMVDKKYVIMTGSTSTDVSVADACANLLNDILNKAAVGADQVKG
jgi:hypothetical protein